MWPDFDLAAALSDAGKLLIAFGLAFPVGWEREKDDRSAGLRTFPLVALGSCAYMLLVADRQLSPDTLARMQVGVMTGIGFIGGGAIVKAGGTVHGMATAASIWNMGAIGAAVSSGHYAIAILLSLINYVTLLLVSAYQKRLKKEG